MQLKAKSKQDTRMHKGKMEGNHKENTIMYVCNWVVKVYLSYAHLSIENDLTQWNILFYEKFNTVKLILETQVCFQNDKCS